MYGTTMASVASPSLTTLPAAVSLSSEPATEAGREEEAKPMLMMISWASTVGTVMTDLLMGEDIMPECVEKMNVLEAGSFAFG